MEGTIELSTEDLKTEPYIVLGNDVMINSYPRADLMKSDTNSSVATYDDCKDVENNSPSISSGYLSGCITPELEHKDVDVKIRRSKNERKSTSRKSLDENFQISDNNRRKSDVKKFFATSKRGQQPRKLDISEPTALRTNYRSMKVISNAVPINTLNQIPTVQISSPNEKDKSEKIMRRSKSDEIMTSETIKDDETRLDEQSTSFDGDYKLEKGNIFNDKIIDGGSMELKHESLFTKLFRRKHKNQRKGSLDSILEVGLDNEKDEQKKRTSIAHIFSMRRPKSNAQQSTKSKNSNDHSNANYSLTNSLDRNNRYSVYDPKDSSQKAKYLNQTYSSGSLLLDPLSYEILDLSTPSHKLPMTPSEIYEKKKYEFYNSDDSKPESPRKISSQLAGSQLRPWDLPQVVEVKYKRSKDNIDQDPGEVELEIRPKLRKSRSLGEKSMKKLHKKMRNSINYEDSVGISENLDASKKVSKKLSKTTSVSTVPTVKTHHRVRRTTSEPKTQRPSRYIRAENKNISETNLKMGNVLAEHMLKHNEIVSQENKEVFKTPSDKTDSVGFGLHTDSSSDISSSYPDTITTVDEAVDEAIGKMNHKKNDQFSDKEIIKPNKLSNFFNKMHPVTDDLDKEAMTQIINKESEISQQAMHVQNYKSRTQNDTNTVTSNHKETMDYNPNIYTNMSRLNYQTYPIQEQYTESKNYGEHPLYANQGREWATHNQNQNRLQTYGSCSTPNPAAQSHQFQTYQLQPHQLQPHQLQPHQLQKHQLQPHQLQPDQLQPYQLQPYQQYLYQQHPYLNNPTYGYNLQQYQKHPYYQQPPPQSKKVSNAMVSGVVSSEGDVKKEAVYGWLQNQLAKEHPQVQARYYDAQMYPNEPIYQAVPQKYIDDSYSSSMQASQSRKVSSRVLFIQSNEYFIII